MSAHRTQVRISWYTSDHLFSANEVVSRTRERLAEMNPASLEAGYLRPFMTDVLVAKSPDTGIQELYILSDPDVDLYKVVNFVGYFRRACLGRRSIEVSIDGNSLDMLLLNYVGAVDEAMRGLKGTMKWIKDDRIARIRRNLEEHTRVIVLSPDYLD